MRDYRADLETIFMSAVEYADPERLVREKVVAVGGSLFVDSNSFFPYKKVYMFAIGKAASAMARGLISVVEIDRGVVVSNKLDDFPSHIKCIKAGHPIPDEGSIDGAKACVELAAEADEDTLCVFLISGGGSAMVCSPAFGITVEEKVRTFELLSRAGADIEDINTVRRHISNVKGGRLYEMAKPATVVTLAISDVLSNAGNAVASGPTYYDETTWGDVYYVVKLHRVYENLPPTVQRVIMDGLDGNLPETCKDDFSSFHYFNIGSNISGMFQAADRATSMGYAAKIFGGQFECDVKEAAEAMAKEALEQRYFDSDEPKPVCLIFGGEVTVKVQGDGKGGRCQQLALEYLLQERTYNSYCLCASTDGMDGDTDAAGAYVDGHEDINKAAKYAENNDAYNFFESTGGLFKTGLTGTNINDIYLVIIPETELACLLSMRESERECIGDCLCGNYPARERGMGDSRGSYPPEQSCFGTSDKNRSDK